MKLNYEQLFTHLKRGLLPAYVLTGDEPLLLQEASDAVLAAAIAAGYSERLRFSAEPGFDWGLFQQAYQNTSLFGDQQYIELHLPSAKLTEAGKEALMRYMERPSTHKILVITTGKIDAAGQKNNWYKMIEKLGAIVTIYPLQPSQLQPWIVQRLQKLGLEADMPTIQLLALRTQGNLLAAAQEIEKLSLLYVRGKLTLEQVAQASSDNARYDIFNLADAVLQGNVQLSVRMMLALKAEAQEPTLVLWALLREIRQLIQVQQSVAAGKTLAQGLVEHNVWEKRKPWVSQALKRHALPALYGALQHAAQIDRVIKGAVPGNVWDQLIDLALKLAGAPLTQLR